MQIEASGKNVELAIQNGLLECGMRREDVNVKVVDEGGLFKKAKVILTWGETETSETEEIEQDISEETIEQVEQGQEEQPIEEKKKRVYNTERIEKAGKEFLLGLAKLLDESAIVEASSGENEVSFSIKGGNLGKLIGYHGENIQALQMLLSGVKTRGEGGIRLYLDIDGYKQNRNQTIIDLANKIADQAVKIERNIHMDPMNAYDRRIVHTTLQEREDVTTESTGEGEKRHVVVKPIFKK